MTFSTWMLPALLLPLCAREQPTQKQVSKGVRGQRAGAALLRVVIVLMILPCSTRGFIVRTPFAELEHPIAERPIPGQVAIRPKNKSHKTFISAPEPAKGILC